MLKKTATALALAAFAALSVTGASAATFFGQDQIVDPNDSATWTNSKNARASFLSGLVGVGSEDFESFSSGQVAPLAISFPGSIGSITANLLGSQQVLSSPDGQGRFNTTEDVAQNSNYWRVRTSQNFEVQFDQEVAAFGFYGTDIGDFDGQLVLTAFDSGGVQNGQWTIGAANSANGNLLFWGVTRTNNPFTRLSFTVTGNNDTFGFDDFIVGDLQQVSVDVPLPGAGLLLISGIAGLAGMRRLRRKA